MNFFQYFQFLRIHLRASESRGRGPSTPGWGTRPTRRRRTSATRTGTMAVSTRGRRTTRLVTYCVQNIVILLVYLLWRGILHIMYVSMLQRHSPWGIMYRHQRKGRIPASRRIRILVRKVYRVRSPEQNRFVWSSSAWPARGKLLLSRGDIFFLVWYFSNNPTRHLPTRKASFIGENVSRHFYREFHNKTLE